MALGRIGVEEIGDEVGALVRAKPPAGVAEAWDLFKRGLELRHARPVAVGRGLVRRWSTEWKMGERDWGRFRF